jgi:hypothetical protein
VTTNRAGVQACALCVGDERDIISSAASVLLLEGTREAVARRVPIRHRSEEQSSGPDPVL